VSDSLCRLTVQCGDDREVDLALPDDVSIGRLMPSLIDIVLQDSAFPVTTCRWRLSWIGGPTLDDSLSLKGNEVHDGELLLLTAEYSPAPQWVALDPSHTVAQCAHVSRSPRPILRATCGVVTAGGGAAALVFDASPAHAIVAVTVGAASTAATVMAHRRNREPNVCVSLALVAVMFAAVTGLTVIPASPRAAHVLLAATAAFCVATTLTRLMDCGTVPLTAIAAVASLIAGVALVSVVANVQPSASGALLTVLSLGALAAAPRMSMSLTGIGPPMPNPDSPDDHDVVPARAVRAHQRLTGLVIGASAGAAVGIAAVAVGPFHGTHCLSAAVLASVIGLVLLLRERTHVDGRRRIALMMSGMFCVTMCFGIGVLSLPSYVPWLGALAAAVGAAVLSPVAGLKTSPLVQRAVEIVEYVGLAAVVPVACWVAGVFGLVRGMSVL
jgi:type VII secretion integral membrane protein EccD